MKELELTDSVDAQSIIQPRFKTLRDCDHTKEINNHKNEILFNNNISNYKTTNHVYYEVYNTEVRSYGQVLKQVELNTINDYYLYKHGMPTIDMV